MRTLALHVRGVVSRGLVLERPIWSWVMVVGAVSRAASYWIRPPESSTPAAARIEGALSYPAWTTLLLTYALLIALGTAARRGSIAWLGHLIGIGACGTLALSILFAAVLDGASWSGFWPLVVVGLVHYGRANALGPKVADRAAVKRAERRR